MSLHFFNPAWSAVNVILTLLSLISESTLVMSLATTSGWPVSPLATKIASGLCGDIPDNASPTSLHPFAVETSCTKPFLSARKNDIITSLTDGHKYKDTIV